MNRRWVSFFLALVLVFMVPAGVLAQALVPPKGEVFFSLNYQWLEAGDHLFSEPWKDYGSTSVDLGKIRSQVLVFDGDLGITDKLAFSGQVAFIQSRFQGPKAENPDIDDGSYHGSFQDARFGIRYMALNESWVLTPFGSVALPTTDYPVIGHAAVGRGLNELQLGMNVGRFLFRSGAPKAFLMGSYSYAFMENVSDEMTIDRSNVQLGLAYFLPHSFTLQVWTNYQNTHGGIDWSRDLDHSTHTHDHGDDLTDFMMAHDQTAATDFWRMGATVSFPLGDAADLYVGVGTMPWGINTHDSTTVAFGMSWNFRAFGGVGRSENVPANDESEKTTESR